MLIIVNGVVEENNGLGVFEENMSSHRWAMTLA